MIPGPPPAGSWGARGCGPDGARSRGCAGRGGASCREGLRRAILLSSIDLARRCPAPHRDLGPVAAGGKVSGLRRGDQRLAPALPEALGEQLPAGGVELAHHVVEEHQRRRPARLEERAALCEKKGQQGRALLTLRPVPAYRPTIQRQLQLVEVGPVLRVPALDVV